MHRSSTTHQQVCFRHAFDSTRHFGAREVAKSCGRLAKFADVMMRQRPNCKPYKFIGCCGRCERCGRLYRVGLIRENTQVFFLAYSDGWRNTSATSARPQSDFRDCLARPHKRSWRHAFDRAAKLNQPTIAYVSLCLISDGTTSNVTDRTLSRFVAMFVQRHSFLGAGAVATLARTSPQFATVANTSLLSHFEAMRWHNASVGQRRGVIASCVKSKLLSHYLSPKPIGTSRKFASPEGRGNHREPSQSLFCLSGIFISKE